jgi:hypothetical protein
MPYRVELTDRAARNLAILYEEKIAAESIAAARGNPRRCPIAPESRSTFGQCDIF